jgi:hypothetical protein
VKTPKPTPRDLDREARRLERARQLEAGDRRVVELRQRPERLDPAPDPKAAA